MKVLFNMRLKTLWAVILFVNVLFFTSCSDDKDSPVALAPEFEWITQLDETTPFFVIPGQSYQLEYSAQNANVINIATLPEGWNAQVDETNHSISIQASENAVSKITLTVNVQGEGEQKISSKVDLYCLNSFDDPNGTFVLNEGNMTTENGSLTYITPEGYVIDDAYKAVNGTELGNVAQDMAFCDGKIYIISQNGDMNAVGSHFDNDGMLIVVNAKTLKKEIAFSNAELPGIDWPSHIAVIDEQHVYIRDNEGIKHLDMSSKELKFVEGTEQAPKSQFFTRDGKVYTYKPGLISGIIEITPEDDSVKKILFPYTLSCQINTVLGIKPADDGDIWVMSFGAGKSAISKFNPTTRETIQRQISVQPSVGSSGMGFAVKGNTFYYADGTTIYQMNFNDDPALDETSGLDSEEILCDLNTLDNNAGMLYNNIAVHPKTGQVYINTIKSYAQFQTNQIWAFDFNASKDAPAAKYENYTNFPAGCYFYPEN